MDQVITFDKSLQQRLQEYSDIFTGYDVLPVSAIQKEWSFYLDLTIDTNGWQAVWKIQRKTCEANNIPFPAVALVFVLSVDVDDLTALVKILAVQDDIHIPEKHRVPLIQLWPTKEQEKSIFLNLQSTANALDMLRFFYHNLFLPWDYEEDDAIDWKSKHLEPRLRLYYDMKNGVLPRVTAEHLHSLMTESRRLQAKQEELESELDHTDNVDEENIDINDAKVQALMELHIRMMQIKGEIDILENPLLRGAVIKKHKEMSAVKENNKQQTMWVVYGGGTAGDCIQFLSKVESLYPEEFFKFSSLLGATLIDASSNDIFILNESTHIIKSTGALEQGGILKGISEKESTILTSALENVMLDFSGDNIILENITIEAKSPQVAIIVRRGHVTLNNCKLIGDGKSSTHQGVIVLNGGTLEVINCDISHFCTAIVGNSGSFITIEGTEIHDCNFGLKIYDNCAVKAVKTMIRNCKDYGICVETENNFSNNHPKIGDFDTLNIIPKLELEFITGNNNIKGDAIINQKSMLHPIEDLFQTRDSDPTICFESDEDMDTHQETVIENPCKGKTSPVTV